MADTFKVGTAREREYIVGAIPGWEYFIRVSNGGTTIEVLRRDLAWDWVEDPIATANSLAEAEEIVVGAMKSLKSIH